MEISVRATVQQISSTCRRRESYITVSTRPSSGKLCREDWHRIDLVASARKVVRGDRRHPSQEVREPHFKGHRHVNELGPFLARPLIVVLKNLLRAATGATRLRRAGRFTYGRATTRTGRSFAISNEVNWIDLDQYRNGASCAGRLWIEDVCCAELSSVLWCRCGFLCSRNPRSVAGS